MILYILMVSLFYCFINYLLIIGTARLLHCSVAGVRCVLAAVFGSIYVFLCLLLDVKLLNSCWTYCLVIIFMSVISYGLSKNRIIVSVVFTLFNLLLGGIDVSVRGMISLFLGSIGVFLICVISRDCKNELVPVEIYHLGKIIKINALRDTGNNLTDPVTGQSVLVVGADVSSMLTGLSQSQLRSPVESMGSVCGLRLIPYQTISEQGKFLLAKRIDKVKIGTWQGSAIIAFSPESFSSNGRFQALIGGKL